MLYCKTSLTKCALVKIKKKKKFENLGNIYFGVFQVSSELAAFPAVFSLDSSESSLKTVTKEASSEWASKLMLSRNSQMPVVCPEGGC